MNFQVFSFPKGEKSPFFKVLSSCPLFFLTLHSLQHNTTNLQMTSIEKNKSASRVIIQSHIDKALSEKIIQWNDGLDYTEFIRALWRLFLYHESFKQGTQDILGKLSEEEAMQLLSDEIDITKLKAS